MALYSYNKKLLKLVEENPFKLEKEIQLLIEKNLMDILELEYVKSEFSIENFRIDTLAFDKTSNSFVIIEYKKGRNLSVIDQGFTYLSLMLNNKADFILEYNETLNSTLKKDSVDWSQSKVIFISPSFTTFQKESINFKDLPIELFEIKRYENNLIGFEKIRSKGATESIKTISSKDETIKNVTKEIKVYTEEEHLINIPQNIIEQYEQLKEMILNLGDIEIKPTKLYIGFSANSTFVDVLLQRSGLKIWFNLRKGSLEDPKNFARDISEIGHWGNGDYEIKIKPDFDLDYIMNLVRQSYEKHK